MSDSNHPTDPTANDPYASRPADSDPYASGSTSGATAGSVPPPPPAGGYGDVPPAPPAGGGYGQMPPAPPAGAYGGGPVGTPPPNYLVWAILSTLFCCLPLGVASIVFAAQVNSKWAMGDYAGAQDSSQKAKKFAIWSAIAGVVVGVLYGILMAVGVVSLGASTSTPTPVLTP